MKLDKLGSLTSEYITELAKNLLHKILWKNLNELFGQPEIKECAPVLQSHGLSCFMLLCSKKVSTAIS